MQNIIDYYRSVKFSLSFSFKYVPALTYLMVFLYIASGVLPYVTAFLLGKLVDAIVLGVKTSSNDVWYALFLYALMNAMPTIVGNVQKYTNRLRMLHLQMETDLEILQKRESIDIVKYEDPQFQDLIQRTFRGGPNPIYQMSNTQFDIIRYLTSLILGTILAIHFSPYVYLIVILTAVLGFITDIKYAGKGWSIWAKDSPEQRRLGDLRQHITSRTFLIETKLLQSGKKLFKMMREIFTDFKEKQIKLEHSRVWQTSISDLLALVGFAGGLVLVVKGVMISEGAKVGTLVYMMSTLSNVRSSISNLLDNISGQFENHLIVQDMIKFMATKPAIVEPLKPIKLNLSSAPKIVFENVSFKYQNSKKWSLRNVSLTFNAGENIGLVGNNGAGKTTLVKLLSRIYDPTEGRILINDVDLKDVSTKEWWSYFGVMFQDYATYDFLVKDAIAIGRPDKALNLTKVVDASRVAQSHDFIVEWDNKYDEQLGVEFKGKEPSKGQRQKLSIAKTLYRDGFVMILDEPTASVDAESEAKIFDSIENLPKDRTAILISHDFSTISQCDRIFVLDKASLIEEGNHKELMKKKGMYAELYNLQAKRFKK